MKVALGSIDVDEDVRRAINFQYGKPGLATRAEVRDFYLLAADTTLQDVVAEWREEQGE